ncbi:transposase [Pseudoduganella sp. UC29_71]|uniref:transposase n=1 Tax=Pseudoduganella sp. UC29_71 TaxID=3350174 RepID=UPI0036727A52
MYLDDKDRLAWLAILARVCKRFNFVVHAFCQMGHHYHLFVETVEGNLSRGMRQLNGVYAQHFNRRHQLVGHLFQGRYHAILVQKEAYLLELARYLVLNPVRANMVQSPAEWPWSSYAYMLGNKEPPEWLDTDSILSRFSSIRIKAVQAYIEFVAAGSGLGSPLLSVSHQLLLGDAEFVERYREWATDVPLSGLSKTQRRLAALTLEEYKQRYPDRDEAMAKAHFSTVFTMAQIAEFFKVSVRTVSRAVEKFERERDLA